MPETKTNVMRILDQNKIPYRVHTYVPDEGSFDGVIAARKAGLPVEQVYKTLVAQGKSGAFFVFVIPVAGELDLKKAAKAVGEKSVALIPVREINRITGYIRGGCSPIGMKKRYATVLDQSAFSRETIVVSAGKIGFQVELRPDALCGLIHAESADLLASSFCVEEC